jgi:hypothetical protein
MPDINARRSPENPDLAQERKRAKELLKALRSGDDNAIARFRSHHPRFAELTQDALQTSDVKLSDAQWVIAREYGFPSWQLLKARIEQVSGRAATATTPHSVLIWNDNATPMDFVVHLLQVVFLKTEDNSEIRIKGHGLRSTMVSQGRIPLVYRMSRLSIQTAIPTKLANRMATLPNETNPIRISKIRWPIDPTASV